MQRSLLDYRPDSQLYWDCDNEETPENYSKSSGKIAKWKCPDCSYKWSKSIAEWNRYSKCPACDARDRNKISIGINDICSTDEEAVKNFWDYERNDLPPSCYKRDSRSRVFWKGSDTRSQITSFLATYYKNNNPLSVATLFPELLEYFHDKSNAYLLTARSKANVLFDCPKCGHQWESKVVNFVKKKSKCPYCSFQKLSRGFNDLLTTDPKIAKELTNYPSNEVMRSSNKIGEWKCVICKGEWKRNISQRVQGSIACPYCSNKRLLSGFNDINSHYPELEKILSTNNTVDPRSVIVGSNTKLTVTCDCGIDVEHPAYYLSRVFEKGFKISCSDCRETNGEAIIRQLLNDLAIEYRQNDRELLSGAEVDFYVPSKKIAIEFNGNYWHSELFRDKDYHYNKWRDCNYKDVQLIQVWEDQLDNIELLRRMLSNKLGCSSEEKVNARTLSFVEVSKSEAYDFLQSNHIQGFSISSYYFGLQQGKRLVAVLTLTKTNGVLLISRYATDGNIRGGFTKLLKNSIDFLKFSGIVRTFASRDVSNGNLYKTAGFQEVGIIPPDYFYLAKGKRKHKSNYRKDRFLKDPSLEFKKGKTEKELADMNGLIRIWDSGKIVFEKTYDSSK